MFIGGSMTEILKRLQEAQETGQVIGIIYHGGSQPGSFREISPIKLYDNKVSAHCYASDLVKSFNLDKIELRGDMPTQEEKTGEWDFKYVDADRFGNPDTILSTYQEYLTSLGWHVLSHFDQEFGQTNINLHTFFKNGKLRKTPVITISHSPLTSDCFVQYGSSEILTEYRESSRPWSLGGKVSINTRTFAKADKAVYEFLKLAKNHAPYSEELIEQPLLPKTAPISRPKKIKRRQTSSKPLLNLNKFIRMLLD